ncbi:MAG: hypothetical protein HUK40_03205 [Desulfobacter sp.]|nr:hypothetical protein [Desulfobacter sp.]
MWLGHTQGFARAAARGAPVKLMLTTGWRKFYLVSTSFSRFSVFKECSEFCVTVSVPGSASAPAEVKVRSENGPSISHVGGVDFCWSGVPGTIFSICK